MTPRGLLYPRRSQKLLPTIPHFSFNEDAKNGKGIEHLVQVLSKRLSLSEAEWQIGLFKIFLILELASKLEVLA